MGSRVRRYFRPDWAVIGELLKVAMTGTAQFLINSASWIVMTRLIAQFQDVAIAGYQVCIRILLFFLLPAWGMANAAGPIVAFLNRDPGVQAVAIHALRIISLGYIFYGVGMVLTNAFNGAGDTLTPLIINLFCFWAFQIPLAWLLANYFKFGPAGVFTAILLTESTLTVISFVVFRQGKWKKVKI